MYGLSLCLAGMALLALGFGSVLLSIVLSLPGMEMAVGGVISLLLGVGLCARATSGTPRHWAVGMLVGTLASLACAALAPIVLVLTAFGTMICYAGMVLTLGRTLGDPATAGMSRRAISTSLLIPLLGLVGIFTGGNNGVIMGLSIACVYGGPLVFMAYIFYLVTTLIPRVRHLRDGEVMGAAPPRAEF